MKEMQIPTDFPVFQDSEYASYYEYVWIVSMPSNAMLLYFWMYKYFFFRLTRKPYSKLCQISTMGSIINTIAEKKIPKE